MSSGEADAVHVALDGPFVHGIKYVAITGTPAAGKSTLAADLGRLFKVPVLSAGDVARSIDGASLAEGAMAQEGAFRAEWKKRMIALNGSPAILEGIPRKLSQRDLLPPLTLTVLLVSTWPVAERRSKERGRIDDGFMKKRYQEQVELFGMEHRVQYIDTWVTRLATNDRVMLTDWLTPEQVSSQVAAHLRGDKPTIW
jgi:hypothetical protein